MEKNLKYMCIYVYKTESFCCTPETNGMEQGSVGPTLVPILSMSPVSCLQKPRFTHSP